MRIIRWAAPTLTVVAIVLVALSGLLEDIVARAVGNLDTPIADLFWPASWLGLPVIGSLIVMMRPENRVGWTMVGVGSGAGLTLFVTAYARWAYVLEPGAPLADVAGWMAAWIPVPVFGLIPFLFLLFPTGYTVTRGRRVLARLIAAWLALLALWQAFTPVTVAGGFANAPKFVNPWGIERLGDLADTVTPLLAYVVMALSLVAVISLPVRLRRAEGLERQQLKAFVFAACMIPVLFIAMIALQSSGPSEEVGAAIAVGAFLIMFNGLAAAIAIAVLRYRLYDIDVIINRALVYTALTAVLVGAYAGGVLLFRTILDPLTGDNDIAIAASTLAVAALFGPARRKIQSFIDRRFYRSRYDARRTLDDFGSRLRDEVELGTLTSDLLGVVRRTVAPRHASLWLAKEAR